MALGGDPDGPPLVLLHGLAARWQAFGPLLPALSPRWRVIAPDFRGHGASAHAPGTYAVPTLIDDVDLLLQELGCEERAVVYGHSLGGWTALGLAALRPTAVRAVVVGDTKIEPRAMPADMAVSYLANVPIALKSLAQALQLMDPAVMEAFRAGSLAAGFVPSSVLPSVRCPVLLLQADPAEGGLMSDTDVALALDLLPDAVSERFDGVGHGLHVEAAGRVLDALERFVDRLGPPGARDGVGRLPPPAAAKARTTTMTTELPDEVQEYLRTNATLSLATASSDGAPHATTLLYANEGSTFYVWTRPDTTTSRHMDENPRVAFTIDTYASDWRSARGVQAQGEARQVLDPDERRRFVEVFERKFQGLDTAGAEHVNFYKLLASQVHYIHRRDGADEARRLGTDFERDLVYSVFRELPREDVSDITATLETESYSDGDVIVRQGMPADKFFIIVQGSVEVVRDDEGTERPLGTLKAGQFFGEIAILRDSPRTATVRATGDVTVLAMDRDTFRGMIAKSLGTSVRIDEIISERLSRHES